MRWCPTFPFSWLPKLPLITPNLQEASCPQRKPYVEAQTSLGALFKGLEGSKLVIPSIEALSPAWKVDINPHLESIQNEYHAWADELFKDERIRRKVAACDGDRFAAMGYPRTGREELLNLSKLIAWYFPWDDAIDDAAMLQQPADVMRYRDETIQLTKASLLSDRELPSKPGTSPAIQSFWDIGTSIRSRGSPESNQRFAEQQSLFISSSAQSQIDRKDNTPVTEDQYLRRREDNIGTYPLVELAHYANRTQIPAKWQHEHNEHMRIMCKEIAWMVDISNDILSLRRELIHGQFESMIPLLMYHQKLSPQAAIDRSVAMLHESYERFYTAEQKLYDEVKADDDPDHLIEVKAYVQLFKDIVMGNLHWSYGLKRYMEPSMIQADGTVVFDIRLP